MKKLQLMCTTYRAPGSIDSTRKSAARTCSDEEAARVIAAARDAFAAFREGRPNDSVLVQLVADREAVQQRWCDLDGAEIDGLLADFPGLGKESAASDGKAA